MALPQDIANQALDAIGADEILGDMADGSKSGKVVLRAYGQCLRQLLRASNWSFARKTAPLVLLGDSTGQTVGVGSLVPQPWLYSYQYPIDCVKARFVPWSPSTAASPIPSGNIGTPSVPLMTNLNAPIVGQRLRPARFVIAADVNYPPSPDTNYASVQGVSQIARTVVLTNVQNAQLVYTMFQPYPNVWDALFRAAFVAYLASEIALGVHKDKKFAIQVRAQQIAIAKQKLMEARLVDGNETWSSSDIAVDWMRTRNSGGSRSSGWGDGDGPGVLGYGWDSLGFADGTAY